MGSLGEGALIDKAIEESVRTQVFKFIEIIIQREKCAQGDLAQRLGVTPQYLSAIKSGSKLPGYQTFNFLKILAANAQAFRLASPDSKLIA